MRPQITTSTPEPASLSAAMLMALDDMKSVKASGVRINMCDWVYWVPAGTDRSEFCEVCMAGAVMYERFVVAESGVPISETKEDVSAYDVVGGNRWEDVFLALNSVRQYQVEEALLNFYGTQVLTPKVFDAIYTELEGKVPQDSRYPYRDDPVVWEANMRIIAGVLAIKGF